MHVHRFESRKYSTIYPWVQTTKQVLRNKCAIDSYFMLTPKSTIEHNLSRTSHLALFTRVIFATGMEWSIFYLWFHLGAPFIAFSKKSSTESSRDNSRDSDRILSVPHERMILASYPFLSSIQMAFALLYQAKEDGLCAYLPIYLSTST